MDVIVNTVSTNLQLSQGAVSKAILQAAGPGIELEARMQKPNGIGVGELVETSPGTLAGSGVHMILHTALAAWPPDPNQQQTTLDV